ncbi:MAG TPA: hypothetical protein VGK96_28290 [Candidatus Sulfotelmatobacter sp.]|jgi:hypothetical protein
MAGYSYVSFAQLQASLLQRLQDINGVFTSTDEAQLYLIEALRVLNAQTATWVAPYQLDFNSGDTWKTLTTAPSPRVRTVTDTEIYTQMEYMLLEKTTGSTWTGTSQFNITNLSEALQYRRDELLQYSGANVQQGTALASPIVGVTTQLPETTIDLRRVRWIPQNPPSVETPYALAKEDRLSANAYGNSLLATVGPPESWMITANTPIFFDCSSTPNSPGTWDLITLQSGVPFDPPTANLVGLPDDWCWAAMYGALADCLANAPEATDDPRAKYCLMRYQKALKGMVLLPWILWSEILGLPVDTVSVDEMDAYAQNWENTWRIADPQLVTGGMDLVATAPFVGFGIGFGAEPGGFGTGGFGGSPPATVSTILTLVGNAPVDPSIDVQLSPDGVEAILCYAQHLAMFKMGGAEFLATLPLYQQFEEYCLMERKRKVALGIFTREMLLEGHRGEELDPRYALEDVNAS